MFKLASGAAIAAIVTWSFASFCAWNLDIGEWPIMLRTFALLVWITLWAAIEAEDHP